MSLLGDKKVIFHNIPCDVIGITIYMASTQKIKATYSSKLDRMAIAIAFFLKQADNQTKQRI